MLVLAHGSMVIFMTSISSVITMNITRILKIVVKIFGRALLCQQCANVSACNLKIEVIDRISKRFTTGKALSVCFPRVVAKYIHFTFFLFCLYFFKGWKVQSFLANEGDLVRSTRIWRRFCPLCRHVKGILSTVPAYEGSWLWQLKEYSCLSSLPLVVAVPFFLLSILQT